MTVLVAKKAPDFTAPAVLGNGEITPKFNLSTVIKNKYAVVFFYPLDFTFVCPSELLAVDHRMAQFKALGVEVIGISIDSQYTHHAWRNTPVNKGGIGHVKYTLVADINHHICKAYGIEHEAGVALRGTFIIDREGIVRAEIVNDLPIGRQVDEWLRLVEAVQYHEEHGEVCPAGWTKGAAAIKANPAGIASYLDHNADKL